MKTQIKSVSLENGREHLRIDYAEHSSAFVDCDLIVYRPPLATAGGWDQPSFSVWIVPGTAKQ